MLPSDDEARRIRRRFWLRVSAVMLACVLGGFFLVGEAFHVTDPALGGILLLAGKVVTVGGVLGATAWGVARDPG